MYIKKDLDAKNIQLWSKVIQQNQMLYPSEKVVAFLARNFKNTFDNESKKALDIGFGSGRHLKVLLDYQFQTYGIDYSEESVNVASNNLGDPDKLISIQQQDLSTCEFNNEYFDAIICYGVLFLRPLDEMKKDLERVYQILTNGGKVITNFVTKEDSLYGKGENISHNSFILDETADEYKDMIYTFLEKGEAIALVESCGFKVQLIEREDYWKKNLTQHRSWWILTLIKESTNEN